MTNTLPHGSPGAPSGSVSNSSPGSSSMPRRSSYASVAAGAGAGGGGGGTSAPSSSSQSANHPSYQQPARSGALAHLIHQSPTSASGSAPQSFSAGPPQHQSSSSLHSHQSSRNIDIDMQGAGAAAAGGGGGGGAGGSGSWGRGGHLPSFSSQFGFLTSGPGGNGVGGAGGSTSNPAGMPPNNQSFTPSYLRSSRYMERLIDANKARAAAAAASHNREGLLSTHSSNPGSLSTSSSSVNLHKMAPSHRGMTYDIVEKEPAPLEESVTPLPSRWNDADKIEGIELSADGLEVRFSGQGKSHDHEAAAVRADFPMPPQCGIYYYEVTVVSKGKEGSLIGLGFSGPKVQLTRLPGWQPDSWAYHGDDGRSFSGQSAGINYGPKFCMNDVIGCGVNFRTGCAFFTKNGIYLNTAFRDIKGKLYPSVGMKRPGEHIRANFGQSPFVFDIDGMMATEKQAIQAEINATSTANLYPPLDETSLVQALVAHFLAHDGYIETARAFSSEVRAESEALGDDKEPMFAGFEAKEDMEAVNRQRIRLAILEGDIEKAFKYTMAYYPHVLKDNEQIYFRLCCRKFIEMIRQCSELQLIAQNGHNGRTGNQHMNGHSSNEQYGEVFEHQMELDDQISDGKDLESSQAAAAAAGLKHSTLLDEALKYGQSLRTEFREDNRKEVQKALKETFSLVAYDDPRSNPDVAHLLEPSGRIPVAEELNSAILVSLGKSSSAALERLYQQTEVLVNELEEDGGAGAFINVRKDFLK
ncbi:MAG: hypothetical protein M4579_002891 [Chaenotheca gracillima]|nr:MAG: hypothetical protein M4579_002891 [Chaenotheca gracillima]